MTEGVRGQGGSGGRPKIVSITIQQLGPCHDTPLPSLQGHAARGLVGGAPVGDLGKRGVAGAGRGESWQREFKGGGGQL